MKALLIANSQRLHQGEVMRAVANGMNRHGIETRLEHSHAAAGCEDDFVVTWTDQVPLQTNGAAHLIMECGYINGTGAIFNDNRLRFISASWNRRHGLCDWNWPQEVSGDRWDSLGIELQPWRQGGDYALLLEQHPGDAAAPKVAEFRQNIVQECASFGWKCRVRPHPSYHNNQQTLAEDLADASLAITWCSTASVEAVIAGVPTYTLGPGSIAAPVTRPLLNDDPYTGNRVAWANRLAYRQWTIKELNEGSAWPHIRGGLR